MTNPVSPIDQYRNASPPSAEVLLQPFAAPSILGLYGIASTFMVAANLAHWYGNQSRSIYLAPFAAVFGGLAQVPCRNVVLPCSRRARDSHAWCVGRLLDRLRLAQLRL